MVIGLPPGLPTTNFGFSTSALPLPSDFSNVR